MFTFAWYQLLGASRIDDAQFETLSVERRSFGPQAAWIPLQLLTSNSEESFTNKCILKLPSCKHSNAFEDFIAVVLPHSFLLGQLRVQALNQALMALGPNPSTQNAGMSGQTHVAGRFFLPSSRLTKLKLRSCWFLASRDRPL